MRILILTEYFPNTFKPYFEAQFAQLVRDGHDIEIFAEGKWDHAVNAELAQYRLVERTRYYPTTLGTLPRFAGALAGRVFGHPWAALRAARRAWDGGKPVKLNVLNVARALLLPRAAPDAVLMHDLATSRGFLFVARLYPGKPVALYFHGGEIPLGGAISDPGAREAFGMMTTVFTNTEYSKALAVKRGCDPAKVAIVPVGFRLGDYEPSPAKTYRDGGGLRLVTVGRLSAEKGIETTLDALDLLRRRGVDNVRLRIIGDGPLRGALEARAAALALGPLVHFVGAVPKKDVVAELAAADAMVLASVPLPNVEENQACVLQEALLMKLVLVTTHVGGVQESVPPGMKRYALAPGDPAALADALADLASCGADALARLGDEGRTFAVEKYEIAAVTKPILEVLRGTALRAKAEAKAEAQAEVGRG